MSAPKWTPGPWLCAAAPGGWDAVRELGGQLICTLNLAVPANMVLIAEAPQLYEALRQICEEPITVAASAETVSAISDLMELIRAVGLPVLAKARGEQ